MTVGIMMLAGIVVLPVVLVLLGEREYKRYPSFGQLSAYGMAFLLTVLVALGVIGAFMVGSVIVRTWTMPI